MKSQEEVVAGVKEWAQWWIGKRREKLEDQLCTSSEHMGPLEPFSKRHFSARTFSSLAC